MSSYVTRVAWNGALAPIPTSGRGVGFRITSERRERWSLHEYRGKEKKLRARFAIHAGAVGSYA